MAKLLLKLFEAAELMNCSKETARLLLKQNGAAEIDLGAGRGRGLRYQTDDVKRVVAHLAQEALKRSEPKRRLKRSPSPLDVPFEKLWAEVSANRTTEVVQ